MKSFYDVVIVGAGPGGVATANLLGGYGIDTLIIDKEPDVLNIPRAIGICEEGSRITDRIGAFDEIQTQIRPMDKVLFQNQQRENVLFADITERKHGYRLLSMFYQPALERTLRKMLSRYPHVDLRLSSELLEFKDRGEEVELLIADSTDEPNKGEQLACRYLIACDGASSLVRKSLDIPFTGKTFPQDWLILDCEHNPIDNQEVIFSIDPSRPAVTMPGPDDKRRWEFLIKKDDDREFLMSDAGSNSLLSGWCNPDNVRVERKAIYTFHARTASKFKVGNVFLLGDAAHITPPFAGQGMMAGLRDAYNLSWKIAAVVNKQLGESILDSYSKERIPQCKQVISFARWMGMIILPQAKAVAFLRDGFFSALATLGLYSNNKGIKLEKIPNHINGGLIRHILVKKMFNTGYELPQHELTDPASGTRQPSDRLLQEQFCILGWQVNPEQMLSAGTYDIWKSVNGKCVALRSTGENAGNGEYYLDQEENYAELLGNGRRIIVIRPDKMIVLNCRPQQLDSKLKSYLNSIDAGQSDA